MATGRDFAWFALAALLALPACTAHPPTGAAAAAASVAEFAGDWGYRQSCGWQHSAHLELKAAGAAVTGSWDDGTQTSGDSGQLLGSLREGRLYLRFCSEDVAAGKPGACPDFGRESDYLTREGDTLVWFRASGTGHQPYLKLHPTDSGRAPPDDTRGCEDAAD
ncbi:hypothetical protein LVB77_13735 [Lysobacter sp. 5GHs7-4]|uniref:hypothetical protein n=1 Tax=Lysobacter sp. 5GHs7-4 TaxID=2904253 RepID=UPI001E3A8B7A|nr:hypothetical protein [Lysobacter sp. 5GHs7-4]UHQ21731.1 hypothetical protein LVB77_13735 [Lysobacter sp. 5GHs7-4]